MAKPRLVIDLQGEDGNIYKVITKARQIVPVDLLNDFIEAILDAQLPGRKITYEGMLAIINEYVELIDSSGTYPEYADKSILDETAIIAAVDHLVEQMRTLPDDVASSLEEIYHEFGVPDCGPEMYLVFLNAEIPEIKEKINQAKESKLDPGDESREDTLQRLLSMLIECSVVLRTAGLNPEGNEPEEQLIPPADDSEPNFTQRELPNQHPSTSPDE